MNVVYRGFPNPISIAVNDAESYKVFGNGINQDNDGNYTLSPGSGLTTKVYVEITKNNDSVFVEEHEFRIKGLPFPIATINDEYSTNGILVLSKASFKDAEIKLKMLDFYIEFIPRDIISFSINYKNKIIYIKGNKINKEALNFIVKAKKNSFITIDDIKYYHSVESLPKRIEPIEIFLID